VQSKVADAQGLGRTLTAASKTPKNMGKRLPHESRSMRSPSKPEVKCRYQAFSLKCMVRRRTARGLKFDEGESA
jgi:hypothetical protein